MNSLTAKKIARSAIIASLYAVCTLIFAPISYGAIQFRIAECLCVLAFFYSEGIIGLTLGCFIANIFGNGPLDMIFGTLATFLASLFSYLLAKKIKKELPRFFICSLFPILINAVIVPFTFLAITEMKSLYLVSAMQVGIGQTVVIFTLGLFIYMSINKINARNKKHFKK